MRISSRAGCQSFNYSATILRLPDEPFSESLYHLVSFASRLISPRNYFQDIIDAINNPATVSGISGRPYKIEGQLGDNKKDSSGKIVSAKAMTLFFRGDSSDEGAEESAREWEEEFIDVVIKWSKAEIEPMGVKALPMAARYV